MATRKKTLSGERGNANGKPIDYAALTRELIAEANRVPEDWGGCLTMGEVADLLGVQPAHAGRLSRTLPRKPRVIDGVRSYVVSARAVYELAKKRIGHV